MRPLRLTLQAFGPYRREVVEFARLESYSLFLICGPVGAGKTTLLDGLCFALYGVSSGGERSPQALRNVASPPDLPTLVELEFACGGQTLKVSRALAGEVGLWDAAGESLASGKEAVERYLEDVLGLSGEQFCQAAVVPQGQFSQFLSAPAETKEAILGSLFRTRALSDIQAAITRAAEEAGEEMKAAWQRRDNLVHEAEVAGEEDVHGRLRSCREKMREVDAELARLRALDSLVSEELERSGVLKERSREVEQARSSLEQLRASAGDLEQQLRSLEAYRKAAALAPLEDALLSAEDDLEESKRQLEAIQVELESQEPVAEGIVADVRRREAQRANLRTRLEQLEGYQARFAAREEVEEQLAEGRREFLEVESALAELRDRERATLAELEEKELVRTQAAQLELQADRLRLRLEDARRQLTRFRQARELEGSLVRMREYQERSEGRADDLALRVVRLEREVDELTRSRIRAQAAGLSEHLEPGEPCPVCGSRVHPDPAREGEAAHRVSRELESRRQQLHQARTLVDKIRNERSEHHVLVARMEERLDTLRGELTEVTRSEEDWDQEVATLASELRRLEKLLAVGPRLDKERDKLETRLRKLERRRHKLEAESRSLQHSLAALEAVLAERSKELPPEFGEFAELDRERRSLRSQLQELEEHQAEEDRSFEEHSGEYARRLGSAKAAETALAQAEERLRRARDAYRRHLEQAGFADRTEVHEAIREGRAVQADENELRRYQGELEAAEQRLQRAQESLTESVEHSGHASLHPDRVRSDMEQAVAERERLKAEQTRWERWVEDYHRVVVEIQLLDPRLSSLRRLARTAQGENRLGLSFHRYWVSRLLEEVLVSANRRLQLMTRGRYQLLRSSEAPESSLELVVHDLQAGRYRALATLSGGETFLAALSLALGLADSVGSARRGDSPLEALFIDEGFGFLDHESMDLAVAALLELQREGRVLGLISHLPELRERIAARLEVEPHLEGSRTVLVTPVGA